MNNKWIRVSPDQRVWTNKSFPNIYIQYIRKGKDGGGNNTGFFCVFTKRETLKEYREFSELHKAKLYAESIKDKNEADKDFYRFGGRIFHDVNSNHG